MRRSLTALLLVLSACAQTRNPLDCANAQAPAGMLCVQGSEFLRGSNEPSKDEDTGKMIRDESPAEKVRVTTFYMDIYEVTSEDFQKCIRAGKCRAAHPNYTGYSRPRQPMVGVNWFDARDYCLFAGKRLPTEAEWELAARGPNGDLYPWGNEPASCRYAIIQEKGQKGCAPPGTTVEVGSRPVYRGLYDMAGNSWEWVNDWYADSYEKCGEACRGVDPKGPCGGAENCPGYKEKLVKGGSWWWDGEYSRASNRRPHYPQNKPFHHFGFRCARSLLP